MNEAVKMSIAEHGEIIIDKENKINCSNAEYIEKWYKENITKYIKTIKEEGTDKSNEYYKAAFIDGSGFNSYMSGSNTQTGLSALYIFYCLNYKTCKLGEYDGENQFLFVYNSRPPKVIPVYSGEDIKTLKQGCYNENEGQRHRCTALIEANGWKIPEDYPWIR